MEASINIKFPQEILFSLRETKEYFAQEIKHFAAVKYFMEKKLSLGQCAELAGMSEEKFIKYLSKQNISIFRYEDESELLEDVENA